MRSNEIGTGILMKRLPSATRLLTTLMVVGLLVTQVPQWGLASADVPSISSAKNAGAGKKGGKLHRLIRKPSVQVDGGSSAAPSLTQTPAQQASPSSSAGRTSTSAPSTAAEPLPIPMSAGIMSVSATRQATVGTAATPAPSPITASSIAAPSVGGTPAPGSRGGGRSAQRLVTEVPNLVQLVAPPVSQPLPTVPPSPPVIGASPSSLSFTVTQGSNASSQSLNIGNTGGGTLAWSASHGSTWLTVSPTSGTGPGVVTLTAGAGNLAAGTYTGVVTINASGATAVNIPVTLTITAAPVPPAIAVSPTSLTFSAQQGTGAAAVQQLSIQNSGGGTLAWSATDDAAWLTIAPASGTGSGTLTITAAPGTLSVGTHTATVTLNAPGAASKTVPVSFTLSAAAVPPTISMTPTSLAFAGTAGGSNPAAKTVAIANTGGGTLSWTLADNANWLTATQSGGSVTASVNLAGLAAGTYTGAITVSATGATNSPQAIPVSLVVNAAPSPTIMLSPSTISLSAQSGSTTVLNHTLTISNTGGGTLNWTIADDSTWVSKNVSSGAGSGTVAIAVNPAGLPVGTHTSIITVAATGATNTPQMVPVSLTITPPPPQPTIGFAPPSLAFSATTSGSNPAAQSIVVSNTGTGTLTWTVSDNASWLTATQSGNTVLASVNKSGLAAGTYNATITVAATGATNTPQTIPVSLVLSSQSANQSATLQWNPNNEPDLAGYKVYMATSSGTYTTPIATLPKTVTSYVASGLQIGTTYFFVVTSFDSADNESSWSNEASKSIF